MLSGLVGSALLHSAEPPRAAGEAKGPLEGAIPKHFLSGKENSKDCFAMNVCPLYLHNSYLEVPGAHSQLPEGYRKAF